LVALGQVPVKVRRGNQLHAPQKNSNQKLTAIEVKETKAANRAYQQTMENEILIKTPLHLVKIAGKNEERSCQK
jgi:hypothetical protein